MLVSSQIVNRFCKRIIAAMAVPAIVAMFGNTSAFANVNGAIFTTKADGTTVNANIYDNCCDVYLNGGPGLHAPCGSAGLPDGDYVFQVTDPGGKVLLSLDDVTARSFHVSGGVITAYNGTPGEAGSCVHETSIGLCDSVTGQLMPFAHSPNPRNEFQVWVTPVGSYVASAANDPEQNFGFNNSDTKTDNFKCRHHDECSEPPCDTTPNAAIGGAKYCDANGNGVFDILTETRLANWPITVISTPAGGGTPSTNHTSTDSFGNWGVVLDVGTTYVVCEDSVSGYFQTGPIPGALSPDSQATADSSRCWVGTVATADTSGLDFGNVVTSSICAHKFYDANVSGTDDDGAPVQGWKINLIGTNILGTVVSSNALTAANGSVCFNNLLPGTYTVSEAASLTGNWIATTATSSGDIVLAPCESSSPSVSFGNVCRPASTRGLTLGF